SGILTALERRMNPALARSRLARTYLRERKLSVDVALAAGVCFLPAKAQIRSELRRWTGRIIFPLVSPMSHGYIGRTPGDGARGWTKTIIRRCLMSAIEPGAGSRPIRRAGLALTLINWRVRSSWSKEHLIA